MIVNLLNRLSRSSLHRLGYPLYKMLCSGSAFSLTILRPVWILPSCLVHYLRLISVIFNSYFFLRLSIILFQYSYIFRLYVHPSTCLFALSSEFGTNFFVRVQNSIFLSCLRTSKNEEIAYGFSIGLFASLLGASVLFKWSSRLSPGRKSLSKYLCRSFPHSVTV